MSRSCRNDAVVRGCVPVVQVNDGSNMSGIQVVVEPGVQGWELLEEGAINTGGYKQGASICSMHVSTA